VVSARYSPSFSIPVFDCIRSEHFPLMHSSWQAIVLLAIPSWYLHCYFTPWQLRLSMSMICFSDTIKWNCVFRTEALTRRISRSVDCQDSSPSPPFSMLRCFTHPVFLPFTAEPVAPEIKSVHITHG
jgi:hypothetical protein